MDPIRRDEQIRHALEALGTERFEAFIRAAQARGDVVAAKQMGKQLDAGESVESLFFPGKDASRFGNYRLEVEEIDENRFRVDFGYSAHSIGDGGRWTVTFDSEGRVESLEGGLTWIV